MKDGNHERPEKDDSEEVPVFSDRDLEDYLRVEEEYSGGGRNTKGRGSLSPDPRFPQEAETVKAVPYARCPALLGHGDCGAGVFLLYEAGGKKAPDRCQAHETPHSSG